MVAKIDRYTSAVRESLLDRLRSYHAIDERDAECAGRIVEFVEREERCAQRSLEHGHLTGSAWIVNREGDKVLLLHHRKLGRWLQPGGHADGELNLLSVALREAREESGLSSLTPWTTEIFDLDIHTIPERNSEPKHLHYDVRYVLTADDHEPLQGNNESHGLAWIALDRISDATEEESVLRMQRKWLAARLQTKAQIISP